MNTSNHCPLTNTMLHPPIKSILIKQIVHGFIHLNSSLEPNIFVEQEQLNQTRIYESLTNLYIIEPNDLDLTRPILVQLMDLISRYPIKQIILTIDNSSRSSFQC
jgi:hypothetical protein